MILFLFNVILSLYAKDKNSVNWSGYNVSVHYNESNRVTELIMKQNKKTIYKETFDHGKYTIAGFYKTKEKEFFHLNGYTGGESGCCSLDKFYYKEGKKILSFEIEQLAYSELKIVDRDGDKDEEIMTQSSRFYGLQVNEKELGFSKENCSITSDKLYVKGFSEPVFPEYKKLKQKQNKLELIDVTFDSQFQKALKPYFKKAEEYLEKNKNKQAGENLPGLLQYYYYMSKSGHEKEALEKINQAKIKLKFEGSGTCSPDIELSEFINAYKEKLLTISTGNGF